MGNQVGSEHNQNEGETALSSTKTFTTKQDESLDQTSQINSQNPTIPLTSTKQELKALGLRPEIVDKFAETSDDIMALSDVVKVLEKIPGIKLELKCDGNFQIAKNNSGVLTVSSQALYGENTRFEEFKNHRKRKRKKVEDPSWLPGDEEGSESKVSRSESSSEDESIGSITKLDVNTASEGELEAINGIGPSLARKITEYRKKHGIFYRLDDISAIKGISRNSARKLFNYLTVGDSDGICSDNEPKLNSVSPDNKLTFNQREVVRIISWNLQCFSNEKASNDGVIEVICRTILENGISIAVFQEIGDEEAITQIKDQLNNPTIKGLKKLTNHKSNWQSITSDVAGPMFRSHEYNGFLFDTSRFIEVTSHDLIEKPLEGKKQFSRRPFLGYFKASGFDFVVVSVHLKATGLANEDLGRLKKELANIPEIISAIKDKIPGEKDMLIVGDFNLEPDEEEFQSFRDSHLANIIPATSFTNISTANPTGSKCYDNIWINKHTDSMYYTGRSGVLRDGMRHVLIPDGWLKNGVVSDHCPVWGEFYCDRDVDKTTGDENVEDIAIQTCQK